MEVTFVLHFHLRLSGCICSFLCEVLFFNVLISLLLALGSVAGCSSLHLWIYLACTYVEAGEGKLALLSCSRVSRWDSSGVRNRVWELRPTVVSRFHVCSCVAVMLTERSVPACFGGLKCGYGGEMNQAALLN